MSKYNQICQEIHDLCQKWQRDTQQVRLLAVSKKQSTDAIRELHSEGQQWFAESYQQELLKKQEELQDLSLHWSYIGGLQSNKLRKLVAQVDEIQTLSSQRHAQLLQKQLEEISKQLPVYLQVNLEQEPSKGGLTSVDAALELAAHIEKECSRLSLQGVMAIPSKQAPDTLYQELRQLADQIGRRQLSLGMSGDYPKALKFGSNCLRLGTCLFGARGPQ